jgi:hypothetical protein
MNPIENERKRLLISDFQPDLLGLFYSNINQWVCENSIISKQQFEPLVPTLNYIIKIL